MGKDYDGSELNRRRMFSLMGAGALASAAWPGTVASADMIFSTNKDDASRGRWFSKKQYTDEPIPLYEASRSRLPSPIHDRAPELIELYWACWKLAFAHIKKPTPANRFVSNYLDEAFNPNIFQWDTIFMVMFARYGHHVFPAVQSLDNFYANQHDNGFICREIWETNGRDHHRERSGQAVNPPLFSWAEVESFRVSADRDRLEAVAPVLEQYADWLETARKRKHTAHGLYWNNPLGSGMDNTPRTGSGWVDISAQMVMQYRDLADIHAALGRADRAAEHRARAADIGERINRWMWNDADGLYYDVDNQGRQNKWKTAACFWPMLAGIAGPEREERLIANLQDPDSFWRQNVFPALAADQKHYDPTGRYWRGGVWAPTNYMIIRGLGLQGHHDFARTAAEKYLNQISKVYQDTGTVWELYAPDRAAPGSGSQGENGIHQARPDFVGWTGCGPIAMLIENVIGIQADAANHRLVWALPPDGRRGLEKFRFGDATVSLVCEDRPSPAAPARVAVTTDKLFNLIIHKNGARKSFDLPAGAHQLDVA